MTLTRRGFLGSAASAGAVLALGITPKGALAAVGTQRGNLTPFVMIDASGKVSAVIKHFEMGQGTVTGLTSLIAEELNMRLDEVDYIFAPSDPSTYNNMAFGPFQGTGGSTAMFNSYYQYRQAAAAAREMLITAAANRLNIKSSALSLAHGQVAGGAEPIAIGELISEASALPVPKAPALKSPSEFTIIGKTGLRRRENRPKITGTAKFAMDVQLDNQMVAMIARSPQFGGKAVAFDDSAARDIPGYLRSALLPNAAGVVVYATKTWPAMQARGALEITWDKSEAENRSSEEIKEELFALVRNPATYQVTPDMNAEAVAGKLAQADQIIEQDFYVPLLAHAPMEPLNCTIEPRTDGGITVHDGAQMPTAVHGVMAQVLGLPMEKIAINTLFAGGSFGRRATPAADYHVEAALAFALTDRTRPVKLVWSREDDLTGGYYRPAFAHKIRVGLNKEGEIIAWDHRAAGQSIFKGTGFESFVVRDGVDGASVEGIADSPYQIPGMYIGLSDARQATTVNWWRSVGHSQNGFIMESMMDIVAKATGRDPLEMRLSLLAGDGEQQTRMRGVLKKATREAGWGQDKGTHKFGLAVHHSFQSYVAEVLELSQDADGAYKIEAVTCAVDCGVAVNPDIIKAQMEGGIGYGLGHVMRNAITLENGAVVQQNFPDYEPLRLHDIGRIDTHIIASDNEPTGVGEPGTPPAGAALANALAAFGPRVTSLPMTDAGIDFA